MNLGVLDEFVMIFGGMLDESVISVGLVDGYVVIIVGLVDGIANIVSSEFVKIVGLDGNIVSKVGIVVVVEDDDFWNSK